MAKIRLVELEGIMTEAIFTLGIFAEGTDFVAIAQKKVTAQSCGVSVLLFYYRITHENSYVQ